LDNNHLVASAYDLPNQSSLGSARIFSFDGPKYLPGLAPAGNGAFVTNLNASALSSGTIADARLSSNVALRAGGNNFTANQTITSGNVGIGTTTPNFPLTFGPTLGDKLALFDAGNGQSYGLGITNNAIQIHADTNLSDIIFGTGSSTSLNELL